MHIHTISTGPEDFRRDLDLQRDLNKTNILAKSRRPHSYYVGFAFHETVQNRTLEEESMYAQSTILNLMYESSTGLLNGSFFLLHASYNCFRSLRKSQNWLFQNVYNSGIWVLCKISKNLL